MTDNVHSVTLIDNLCQGCVNCIKRCPTEAIRVRGGKARITESRCIDCGECIRRCPGHAKTAVTNSLADLEGYLYNIALPAPTLYAQFSIEVSIESILCGLINLGFDEVFEVAQGAEIVSLGIRDYLQRNDIPRPAISSACPATVRLIQIQYPELIDHLIPIDAPVEVAARVIRAEASQDLGLDPKEIGVWFITPCPAKMTAVNQPLGSEKSNLTGAIAISKIYSALLKAIPQKICDNLHCKRASWAGVGWAVSGGEATAVEAANCLIVDGIHKVSELLEQISMGKLHGIQYVEALSCSSGCIGGPLTVENKFVAEHRMKLRTKTMKTEDETNGHRPKEKYQQSELGMDERRAIEPRPILRLDEDIFKAMYKVDLMEKTLSKLPGLDCGSCGSPNCKALAEDIAQGFAAETDCVFKLRERVRDLAQEMVNLAEKLPPSLDKEEK